jgi:hypothetical protein
MPSQREVKQHQKVLNSLYTQLKVLLEEQSLMGSSTPHYVEQEIARVTSDFRFTKGLLRSWGVEANDAPDDKALSTIPVEVSISQREEPVTPPKPKKPRRRATGASSDVFVSYDPADKHWVQTDLLPQLEGAGIKAIDQRDFALGVPKIVNIERAVEQSRYVLLVLSPDWVKSEWSAFEALLAQTDGLGEKRWSTLPLLLRPCELPKRIAMLDRTDLTDPAERVDQMRRLVEFILDTSRIKTRSRIKPPAMPETPAVANDQVGIRSATAPAAASVNPARAFKEKYLANLYRKLEAAYAQKSSALSQVDKVSIGEQIEQLEAEIEQIKQELR